MKTSHHFNRYTLALFIFVVSIIVACKRDTVPTIPIVVPPPPVPTVTHSYTKTYVVGNGSGDLTIDGSTTNYLANSLIVITAGSYQTINVKNLNGVTIQNGNGAVLMDGSSNIYAGINFSNCSNDTITRNPAVADTVPYGFICQNNTYRPTSITGVNKNMLFEYLSYSNIGDYTITITDYSLKVWDGTDAGLQGLNLHFNRCKFDNCNNHILHLSGDITKTYVAGLQKNFEVGFCTFINSNSGDLCNAGAVDKFSVHDNNLKNINTNRNNDNGLFLMVGNGDFFQNYAVNYQGHMIRLWTLSFGTTPQYCNLFNNIGIGSRKYSPFEWQSTEGLNVAAAPNTTYCHIRLNNNTAGNLNTSMDNSFDACLVDNYSMPAGSTQEVYNNLLYNSIAFSSMGNRIFQWSSSSFEAQQAGFGNKYFSTVTSAGFDETNLVLLNNSPAKNAGVPGHLITSLDYHQKAFNVTNPSIGAVQ